LKQKCYQQCTIFCTFCSLENGMDWLKQHWQILGIFHSILHHILYYARFILTKMQSRVNFLVDSLYNITSWGKLKILISTTLGVHTPKHNKLCQNRQARQFQILITHSNANDPTTQLITTHKISHQNSFGTYSLCTTL